jgi:aspartyl-tRNA(Asn)/glutamyl-tRNA(Gln) amidotransferase subunit A
MPHIDLRSAAAIAGAVRSGALCATDVVATALATVERRNRHENALVETFAASAMATAERVDAARRRGEDPGPLAGVPIAIKDNLLLRGHIAACGSRMLADFRAPYTATVVQRLLDRGAVVIGRTNMDEFGMGSSTEHSAYGPTRNPWDRSRVPGGSSGGAAAAVAGELCPIAFGSDTGGSVRQPASMCNLTGLKPTYGRMSRYGLVAYASSLDCIGVLAHDAADLALALGVAGPDGRDTTALDAPVPAYVAELANRTELKGLRIGVLDDDDGGAGLDAAVKAATTTALQTLEALGARLVPCVLPHVRHAVSTYYLLAAAEASSNLARYDGVRFGLSRKGRTIDESYANSRSDGFGAEVQLRILLGTHALQHGYHDELYGQATRVRQLLRRDFDAAFAHCDLIASPTSPLPAFAIGSKIDDPVAMYRCDAMTVPASLAGLPALSMPCGFAKGNLPIGLQLTAPALAEVLLLQVANVYQQRTDWHRQRPEECT